MRTHFLARTALAVALATSGLFLAGCDDDDDNVTNPDNPAPIATPTPSPAPSASPTPTPSPTPQAPPEGRATVFVGRVKSVELPMLRIGGIDVLTNDSTTFHRGGTQNDLSGIQVGDIVRVHGSFMDDGVTVLATKISVEP
jgi:hypothetical protein